MAGTRGAATFGTPAEAYDRHVGRYSRELARALMAAASVAPGDRALDVGCGPGGLTGELVALLGAGSAAAVEPSASFADACRRRFPAVRVESASAEALPFEDDTFDHALAQLVVTFMSDPEAGVREMARVTRAGGTVAAAVWDYAEGMTLLRRFWDAAVALEPTAADLDEGRARPLCTPAGLEELWTGSGLDGVRVSPAVVAAEYDDFEDLWQPFERGVGPAGAFAASLPDDRRAALKAGFRRRLGVGQGRFSLTARAWLVTGVTRKTG